MTGEGSYAKAAPYKFSATVSGPKYCGVAPDDDDDDDEETASSGVQTAESTWGAGESAAKEVIPPAPGVNGTSCSMYPACVAVGIVEGPCCPNADAVTLGCCAGFPKAVEEVKVAAEAECSRPGNRLFQTWKCFLFWSSDNV